jgi:hypothetical protein
LNEYNQLDPNGEVLSGNTGTDIAIVGSGLPPVVVHRVAVPRLAASADGSTAVRIFSLRWSAGASAHQSRHATSFNVSTRRPCLSPVEQKGEMTTSVMKHEVHGPSRMNPEDSLSPQTSSWTMSNTARRLLCTILTVNNRTLLFLFIIFTKISMESAKKFNLTHADTALSSTASGDDDDDHDDEYDLLSPQLGRALCCAPCFAAFDAEELITQGNAFDIIMVQSQDNKLYQNSEFLVTFTNKKSNRSTERVVLEVQERDDDNEDSYQDNNKAWFPIIRTTVKDNMEGSDNDDEPRQAFWSCCSPQVMSGKISDLNGAAEEGEIASKLAPFLRLGKNPIRYLLLDNQKVIGVAHANIFLWTHQDRIVVMDIDGTITKSNARGVFDTVITETYKYCHEGVCQLLSLLKEQINTQILYVTSRPIGLATHTRRFLAHLEQDSARLPEGPLLGFGGSISELLIMELISKNTHHFKADMIWKQVVKPFRTVSKASSASPIFLAGVSLCAWDLVKS